MRQEARGDGLQADQRQGDQAELVETLQDDHRAQEGQPMANQPGWGWLQEKALRVERAVDEVHLARTLSLTDTYDELSRVADRELREHEGELYLHRYRYLHYSPKWGTCRAQGGTLEEDGLRRHLAGSQEYLHNQTPELSQVPTFETAPDLLALYLSQP